MYIETVCSNSRSFPTLLLLLQVMAEGKSEEHALEYQELFNEYLLMFEGKLEEFIGELRYCSVAGEMCRGNRGVSFRPQRRTPTLPCGERRQPLPSFFRHYLKSQVMPFVVG